ncbi:MAG: hypothetical protein D6796_10805 [Caldilineae bacterium]|nr:MAG: hypothetical protein D6796_10805 [Caldilineae bacterium]
MPDSPYRHYRSYLLRLWRDGEHAPWRASLENTLTRKRYNFPTLKKLFEFLAGDEQEGGTDTHCESEE